MVGGPPGLPLRDQVRLRLQPVVEVAARQPAAADIQVVRVFANFSFARPIFGVGRTFFCCFHGMYATGFWQVSTSHLPVARPALRMPPMPAPRIL